MNDTAQRWAVVATVNEPPVLVQSFVAWHLSLGAAEIFLYFDRPDDPVADFFLALPQVHMIRCDDRHWQALGRRPVKHEVRQSQNATQAYERTGCDWLVHMDADEFLWPTGNVADHLAAADTLADGLAVPVAERIYDGTARCSSIYDGLFRRPFSSTMKDGHPIFDNSHGALSRGLTGHTIGKAFARTGRHLRIAIHRPRLPNQKRIVPMISRAAGLELLHFDGLTPLHWMAKFLRAAHLQPRAVQTPPPHRLKQMQAVLEAPNEALELHDLLKVADRSLITALDRYDLLLRANFSPQAALETYFPTQDVDVSTEAFDAWLWAEKGDLLRSNGFETR